MNRILKKKYLQIGFVLLAIILCFLFKLFWDINKLESYFRYTHSFKDPNLILILDSISPNQQFIYYKYKFDNGGFGYSKVFYSVMNKNEKDSELNAGIIPDGYKVDGWTPDNKLIITNDTIDNNLLIKLKTGDTINGSKIYLKTSS